MRQKAKTKKYFRIPDKNEAVKKGGDKKVVLKWAFLVQQELRIRKASFAFPFFSDNRNMSCKLCMCTGNIA